MKTDQYLLDDRMPVQNYDVTFFKNDGSEIDKRTEKRPGKGKFRLHLDNAYSELSDSDVTEIAEMMKSSKNKPPRLEYLLCEARALLEVGFSSEALAVAVSAFESFCKEHSDNRDPGIGEHTDGLAASAIRIAKELGYSSRNPRLIRKMVAVRNATTHTKIANVKPVDVLGIIDTTLDLMRLKKLPSPPSQTTAPA